MSDGMGCECAARSESGCCCAGVDWRSGREAFLEERVRELEGAIRNHEKEEYARVPMNFDMNDQTLWRIGGNSDPQPTHDPNTCPKCGGPADNGFDRCMPPNPYHCSKCAPEFKEEPKK